MAGDIKALIEYLCNEGRVIRDAPVVFAVAGIMLAGIIFGVVEFAHRIEVANKDSTIQNLQTQIAKLEAEAKGSTPQSVRGGRHLDQQERAKLAESLGALTVAFTYQDHTEVIIDSSPSCEECEIYAGEFRELINNFPPWTASGGPLPSGYTGQGIEICIGRDFGRPRNATLFASALLHAGIDFSWKSIPDITKPDYFVVIIARQKT
jgi:hypothetical protein